MAQLWKWDLLRRQGEGFRQTVPSIWPVERRVMAAITACQTAVLGGHVE